MTIGMLMDQEICLILGQVSLSSLYQVRNLQKDIYLYGPGGWGTQGMPQTGGGRTHEGPEPACVQTPLMLVWHTQGGKD